MDITTLNYQVKWNKELQVKASENKWEQVETSGNKWKQVKNHHFKHENKIQNKQKQTNTS